MRACAIGTWALLLASCGPAEPPADAGADAGERCRIASDCDDGAYCNGVEQCAPDDPAADRRGCSAGAPPCPEGDACDEAGDACESACPDADGDGATSVACGGSDCDDGDASRSPALLEVCDDGGVDEDCDPATIGTRDADGDGATAATCCNGGGAARVCGPDCDDARPDANPTTTEACDTVDNDCDGSIDEGVLVTCWDDVDRDRFAPAGAAMRRTCVCPVGTTAMPPAGDDVDCDDAEDTVSPGLPELCSNARDDDCDGDVDEAGNEWFRDCDGDGWGAGAAVRQCTSPGRPTGCTAAGAGHVLDDGDCDDDRIDAFPGSTEACNGLDDTCDGAIDESPQADTWCDAPSRRPLHAASAVCEAGACVTATCEAPWLDCAADPSCETDGATSLAHCGACANECLWSPCTSGTCDPIAVDLRDSHACALRSSGAVACWGHNNEGQLGDGTRSDRSSPVAVLGIADAIDVAVGRESSCALHASGRVSCWGLNDVGQLGDGTLTRRLAPVAVSGIDDARALCVGPAHACAQRASGEVWCWGMGGAYEEPGARSTPVVADRLGHSGAVRELACGGVGLAGQPGFTCEVTTDGTMRCIGDVPAPDPGTIAGVVRATAGMRHACVLRAGGSVLCWGDNARRAVGHGPESTVVAIGPVPGLTDAIDVSAGSAHTCAVRRSGAVVCWGFMDGEEHASPIALAGAPPAHAVSVGGSVACVLGGSGLTCVRSGTNMYLREGEILPPP